MRCKPSLEWSFRGFLIVVFALISLRCEEALPTYVAPQNVMDFKVVTAESLPIRLAPPGRQAYHFNLVAENTFNEVFEDSVDIVGSMRIWWVDRPQFFRTYPLTIRSINEKDLIRNGRLLLLPGQKISIDIYWDMKTDSNFNVISKMNFTRPLQRLCYTAVACSDPELFMVEASINIFDKLGYITAEPKLFQVVGISCAMCERPPYCPGSCGN